MNPAASPFGPQARAPRPASNVAGYKRQMLAATPAYVAPAIPPRPAYPAGSATLLGVLDGANEADTAAHLGRQMSAYSPMTRYAQDSAHAAQVASRAQGIAGHRQAVDGPWTRGADPTTLPASTSPYAAPSPMPQAATTQAPMRIGVRARPMQRIGIQGPSPQSRLASTMSPAAGPPAGGTPHAYGPVVPGVDYTPTAIEPTKNTWRPDQGSPSFNFRLHPGMVELDAATLKDHPYQESRAQRGPRSGYARPTTAAPAGMQGQLAAGLRQQAQAAAGRGDFDGVAKAMGSVDALQQNGMAGLLDFGHKAAMQEAQREQAGARIGVLDRTNPGARIGIYTSPEHARDAVTAKTGDPAMGQQAMQTQRMTEAVQAARSGQAFNLDPNDAQAYLEQYHPAIAPRFRTDERGGVEGGDLPDLHRYLEAVKPPGWNDPTSMLGRALGVRIRQAYGSGLSDQLWVPIKPEYDMAKTIPDLGATEWAGSALDNLLHGNPTLHPGREHDQRRSAVDWFNRITQSQR